MFTFYQMTPRQFSNFLTGKLKRFKVDRERWKQQFRAGWEQTRIIYTIIHNSNQPKAKQKTAKQLMPLDWDRSTTIRSGSIVSRDRALNALKNWKEAGLINGTN